MASMEGQNVPYKLRNGTHTHTSNPASDVGSYTLSGCQRFTLVPKTTRTYKETKPILRELESSGRFPWGFHLSLLFRTLGKVQLFVLPGWSHF